MYTDITKAPEYRIMEHTNHELSYEIYCKSYKFKHDVKSFLATLMQPQTVLDVVNNKGLLEYIAVDVDNSHRITFYCQGVEMKYTYHNELKCNVYITNGFKSVKGKKTTFVKEVDIRENDTMLNLMHMIDMDRDNKRNEYINNLCSILYEAMPIEGKKAMSFNLHNYFTDYHFKTLHKWFTEHGFTDVPSVESFKDMKSYSGWCEKSGPDGYGHSCGSNWCIDYATKRFFRIGWSSDD